MLTVCSMYISGTIFDPSTCFTAQLRASQRFFWVRFRESLNVRVFEEKHIAITRTTTRPFRGNHLTDHLELSSFRQISKFTRLQPKRPTKHSRLFNNFKSQRNTVRVWLCELTVTRGSIYEVAVSNLHVAFTKSPNYKYIQWLCYVSTKPRDAYITQSVFCNTLAFLRVVVILPQTLEYFFLTRRAIVFWLSHTAKKITKAVESRNHRCFTCKIYMTKKIRC